MNIVKFKDTIKEGDEVFNSFFKGKYCYCINWKWCVPLEYDASKYIEDSKNDHYSGGEVEGEDALPMIQIELYEIYIDWSLTGKANETDHYQYLNNFVSEELTLEMIKKFRTMVAQTLLGCASFWDDEYDEVNTPKITSMLEYYKNNMMDCALKALMTFSDPSVNLNGTYTDCGCGSKSTTLSQFSQANPVSMLGAFTKTCNCGNDAIAALFAQAGCDCVGLYKKAIYNYMVSVFSDYKFWKCIPDEVLNLYIKYIDAIIKAGLPLNVSTLNVSSLLYGDCSCLSQDSQSGNLLILNNLKKAFQYIIDKDIVAHKNFIFEALYAWSAKLYEVMEW